MYELLKKLRKDLDLSLIVLSKDLSYPVEDLGFEVVTIDKKERRKLGIHKTIMDHISRIHPDIIHYWDGLSSVFAMEAKLLYRTKIIDGSIRYAGKLGGNMPHKALKSLRFKLADRIVANSEAGLRVEDLLESKKALVIHNGIVLARFNAVPGFSAQEAGLDERTIKIVMVAGFRPAKDHTTFIKAAEILCTQYDNLQFVLIGDGEKRKLVQESIPQGIREKYLFLGNREDVEQLLLHCDIGVLLNNTDGHAEGLSNSIMEYMAAGLPVVATNAGGTSELVNDGETGFLVKSFDVQAVVDKLSRLIENQARRIELGKAGRQRIEREFSLKQMTGQYLAVYSDLIKER